MERPFDLDDEGKTWMINKLKSLGYKAIDTDKISRYSRYDLVVNHKNKQLWFELKTRNCASTKWGDIEIEYDKYINLILTSKQIKPILVYFWTDKWAMLDLKKIQPTKVYDKYAQKTYKWDRQKIDKQFVNWSIKEANIKLLDY